MGPAPGRGRRKLPNSEWILAALPIFMTRRRRARSCTSPPPPHLPDAEDELADLVNNGQAVECSFLPPKTPSTQCQACWACARVFVTEDSVSMVSEAVTAGRAVFLLRTGRKNRLKAGIQKSIALLVAVRLLPKMALWGIPRFDVIFEAMKKNGFLNEISYDTSGNRIKDAPSQPNDGPRLNEAKRGRWIVDGWDRP